MTTNRASQTITRPNGTTHAVAKLHAAHPFAITVCRRAVDVKGAELVEGIPACELCIAALELLEQKTDEQLELEAIAAHDAEVAAYVEAQIEAAYVEAPEPAPRTLLVVPCSGAKLDRPAPAGELYRGTLTTMGLAAARRIEHGHVNVTTSILSALHGLLDLEAVVEPYDLKMNEPGSITAEQLAGQLVEAGVQRVVAFTPNTYTAALEAACEVAGVELVAPLAGCRGIGEQRGRLASYRRSGGISSQYAGDLADLGLVHRAA